MAFPDIHTCMKLSAENESLRNKLYKVKQQRDAAQRELSELKDARRTEDLLRNFVTTREVFVQTETRLGAPGIFRPQKKKEANLEDEDISKTNKMLSMHSQLMRRYEKEVKQNMTHIETITTLHLTMADLERKLKERTEEAMSLDRDLKMLQLRSRSKSRRGQRSRSQSPEFNSNDDHDEMRKTRKENHKLKKELNKLKGELKGLDHGFFEEIEDIKYALQQSAKLNKHYEKTLRKTCMQFGIPYPHPELALRR